jgi:hypothetical protein
MRGLSTIGNSSLGLALVAGKNRVPKPATEKTAFPIFEVIEMFHFKITSTPILMQPKIAHLYKIKY